MSVDDLTAPPPAPAPPAPMSPLAKAGIALGVVLLLVVGAWLYGRSSTAPDRAVAEMTRLRAMLYESRTQVLDAQVSLYTTNFGNAAQHLEYAKPPLVAAASELTRLNRPELGAKASTALDRVTEARDLAAKLSLDANSRAAEASRLLGEIVSALPR